MKLYNIILVPCGELRNDCNVESLGVYKNKKDAIKRGLEEYKKDNTTNFYISLKWDLEEFEKTGFLQVFWRFTENYQCYYELIVLELEIDI